MFFNLKMIKASSAAVICQLHKTCSNKGFVPIESLNVLLSFTCYNVTETIKDMRVLQQIMQYCEEHHNILVGCCRGTPQDFSRTKSDLMRKATI